MLGIRSARAWVVLLSSTVAVSMLFVIVLGALFNTWKSYDQQIESLEPRIARLMGVWQSHQELLEANVEINARLAELAYPAGQDTTSTGAVMQQALRNQVQTAGMQISGSQILPPRQDGNLEFISMNLTASGNIEALETMLLQLQSLRPLVVTESLNIQPARARRGEQTQEVLVQLRLSSPRLNP